MPVENTLTTTDYPEALPGMDGPLIPLYHRDELLSDIFLEVSRREGEDEDFDASSLNSEPNFDHFLRVDLFENDTDGDSELIQYKNEVEIIF